MNILSIVIILFMVLETMNILILYFAPGSRKGNAMGGFKTFDRIKADPEIHRLVMYLVNWVAGTKLIFIALLLVILIIGDERVQLYAVFALVISIASFYWRLYPLIRKMDKEGEIVPTGYSRTLALMIGGFIAVFAVAGIVFSVV